MPTQVRRLARRWDVVVGVRGVGVVVAGLLATLLLSACSESSEATPAASDALAQNLALIERVAIDPEATVLARDDDAGPPPGGRGTMSSVVYRAPGSLAHSEIIDLVTDELSDWTVVCRRSRAPSSMVDLRRGDAWVSIGATTALDGSTAPSYSITVNALDGDLMEREFISRQPCDDPAIG